MAVKLSKRTARHSDCDHDDFTYRGMPVYCPQCAGVVTLALLAGNTWVPVGPKTNSHRAARVSV
jgi:hypothetical protein